MKPVFIGGCDRSGTTMLGAILGTHSDCLCVPEGQFIVDTLQGKDYDLKHVEVNPVLQQITKHPRFKTWMEHLDPPNWPGEQPEAEYSTIVEWLVMLYGQKNGKSSPILWVEHTPSNIKRAVTLASIFPDAKLIHLVRDGRAVAASFLKINWGPKSVDQAAQYWLQILAFGLAAESFLGEDRIMRVYYEDLVREPETSLQSICTFLNIDYQPDMLHGTGFKVPAFARSTHALVGKKPDTSRITAWEQVLTSRQVEIFEYICGDLLTYLGYTPWFGVQARGMGSLEKIASKFGYLRMLAGNAFSQVKLRL
jgi:hypothetical protein